MTNDGFLFLIFLDESPMKKIAQSNGKKTKGRVKIKMEFIDNKLRRYTTFSKRKTGIMKKVFIDFCSNNKLFSLNTNLILELEF